MSSAPFNANEQQRNSDDSGQNETVHRTQSAATLAVRLNVSFSMRSIFIHQLIVCTTQFLKKKRRNATHSPGVYQVSTQTRHQRERQIKPESLVNTPGLHLTLITSMTAEE